MGTNVGASTTAAAGLTAVINPVTGSSTVATDPSGAGGQLNKTNQPAPTNPTLTAGMVHQSALPLGTAGQPNPNTTNQPPAGGSVQSNTPAAGSGSVTYQMAQLHDRMDELTAMFRDVMTRMSVTTPPGWPAIASFPTNPQPQPTGTPQQQLGAQNPPTLQHGYSGSNGPASSIEGPSLVGEDQTHLKTKYT